MPRPASRPFLAALAALPLLGPLATRGIGQDADLAGYFGFEPLEVVKVGQRAGPLLAADVDADGLVDLLVVNNHDSRIEVHYQRHGAGPEDGPWRLARVNDLPEHWRYQREAISVTHRVDAIAVHDFDGDGLPDIVFAGAPSELVFLRQSPARTFDIARRHSVKDLGASRDGLVVADVVDDPRPELLAIAAGAIDVWPLDGFSLGAPRKLSVGQGLVAVHVDDLNGDGRPDIVGIVPDDRAPVRIWFGEVESGLGAIGAQNRFEMPPLIESAMLRLPGQAAARLAVIERVSKRMAVYDVVTEPIEESGDREPAIRIHGFTDAGNRRRAHAVVDLDGDGLLDLVATDTEANALVVYRQRPGKGLRTIGESFPSLTEVTYLVAGNVDDDPEAELFVLSEKEGVVGRCDVSGTDVPFPRPVSISAGRTPTALNLVRLEDGPRLAVVAKDGRDYVLDLVDMAGGTTTIDLGKLSRSPEAIVAIDADQDGRTDLLLFTQEKPMTMLAATDDGFVLTESKDMGQFGLVKAAESDNIAVFDVDGDGREELLIADMNFVRAVRYEPEPEAGVSPGWQVVTQINARDADSRLVALSVLGDRIVAADKANDRLLLMAREDGSGPWRETESLAVPGLSFAAIQTGAFSGDERPNVLGVGDQGFAVIRLAGERYALKEAATWRAEDERRLQHELTAGDVNGDGFADLVSLDAGEQMCEIFTFTRAGRMLYATGFQVFESNLFTGSDSREFEPSEAVIADVTGDGADDLVLLAHDRILIYPQQEQEEGLRDRGTEGAVRPRGS